MDKTTIKQLAVLIVGAVLLYTVVQHLSLIWALLLFIWQLFFPFFVGGCIAFILNVPMRGIETRLFANAPAKLKRFQRGISLVLALVVIFAVLFFIVRLIVPEVTNSVEILISSLPAFGRRVAAWATELAQSFPEISDLLNQISFDWQALVTSGLNTLKDMGQSLFNSTVGAAGSLVSGIVNAVIASVFAIYVLLQKEKLARQCKMLLYALLPERKVLSLLEILELASKTFSRFLSGQCVEALILGTMFFVAMTIFRFPYAVMVGALVALTALIPLVGAFIGCVTGAFLILIVDPVRAFWFVIMFLVLQQIEGNLIYPHVVGNSVGLPSIWVLVAVTVGGNLMGIAGMLLFIPICSVAYALLRGWCYQRLKERKISPWRWKT